MKKISRTILALMAFVAAYAIIAPTFASAALDDYTTPTSGGSTYDATPYYVLAGFATLAAYEAFIAGGKRNRHNQGNQ